MHFAALKSSKWQYVAYLDVLYYKWKVKEGVCDAMCMCNLQNEVSLQCIICIQRINPHESYAEIYDVSLLYR